jgi:hypothetical protein
VPPEVSKLIAAVTTLVSALNESAGVSTPGMSPAGVDDRVNDRKEKVASAPGLLVRFNEPQLSDKAWGSIAKIFAKTFVEATAKPDFGDEGAAANAAVPAIIQQTAVVQEKTQEGFFSKLMKFLLPVLALVGGIGLSIAALFQGPGVLGNSMNLVGKLLAKYGQNFIEGIGKRLLSLSDDFLKGIGDYIEGKIKYLSNSIDSIGKMLSGMASKIVSFLPKGSQNLIDNIGKKILSFSDNFLKSIGELATGGLKLIGAGGAGSIGKMLGGAAAKIGGVLLKGAKFIPFLGAAVSFYFAYKRFQDGDYLGMALEIASGILNLTGVGWIGSAIIDVILIARDFTSTKEERAEGGLGIFGKLFGGIKGWFKANGMTILKSLPIVGSILYFKEAYDAGFTTPEGIKKTMIAFASILGAGPLVERAINGLFSLFGEKEDEQAGPSPGTGGKSFFQIAKEFVIKQVSKLPFFLRKPLEWLGIIKSAESESEESWMSEGINKSKEAGKQVLEKMSEFGSRVKDWFVAGSPGAREAGRRIFETMSEFGAGVKDWFVASFPGAKEAGKQVLEKMSEFGSSVKGWFISGISRAKEAGKQVLEKMSEFSLGIKDWFTSGISRAKEAGKQVLEKMSEFGLGIKNWFIASLPGAKEAGKQVLEKMSEFGSGVSNWFSAKIAEGREKSQEIIANITKSGEAIFNATKEVVKNVRNGIERGIGALKNTLINIFNEIEATTNKIIDWVKGIFSWVSEKMGKFLSNIISIFDPREQAGPAQAGTAQETPQISFAENAILNIKNPALDIIADNSNKQVELLRTMVSKLDNISIPAQSAPAPSTPATPTPGSGGSTNRGFGGSSLLSMDTMGGLA